MLLIKIIYILISLSFIYSQSYFDRIIGGDVHFGDARSMGLANSYTTTGSTSSVTSRNPARLSYLDTGNNGFLFDFQFNLRSYYERRSINILDSFGDFLTETDYVSNQHGHSYNSIGFIVNRKNPLVDNVSIGLGLSLMPLASFNYHYEEEVRFQNMDIDTPGDIGIVDATLGFHVYSNKGTINLASLGFGLSIDKYSKGNPISFGFSINQLLSTTITDKIIVDTLYNTIDPSVYNNLSNFETDVNSIKTKTKYYPTYSIELPISASGKNSMVFAFEPKSFILDNDINSNISISNLSGLPWYLDYNSQTNMYNLKLYGTEYFKPKKITFGLRVNQMQTSGSLMIFEFVKEYYKNYHEFSYIIDDTELGIFKLKDIYNYKFAFEHKFRLGPSIRMGLAYKTSMINLLSPIGQFTMGSNKKINKNLDIDFALSYYITSYRYDDIFPSSMPSNQTNCNEYCEKINESNMTISTTFKWEF
tara:strand:+ start:12609 stop:14036 length:1428 start_codon:yes stop_codon:yes gene_type:complete